jgi:uncharacterized SAM-binding protein YcdF (DUF218 family)
MMWILIWKQDGLSAYSNKRFVVMVTNISAPHCGAEIYNQDKSSNPRFNFENLWENLRGQFMFIFLSKFLPVLVYPICLACILLIISLFLRERRRAETVLVLAALVVLWIGGNRWVSMSLTRSLEWQYLPPADAPKVDAIVVLGGSTDAAQYPRPMVDLNSAGDRILYAADLYSQGKAPFILLSGGNIEWQGTRKSTPAAEMAVIMGMLGVPKDALWLQDKSQNTHEDAVFSAQMLAEKGAHRILLVTSALHMPRSMALFKKQGIDVIPAPTDYRITETSWADLSSGSIQSFIINFFPDVFEMGTTVTALKEYFGIAVYKLMGWI